MERNVYQEVLDMINREDIVGLPNTPAMLKVLSLQFTPEEAELALKIGLTGGTLDQLAAKIGMDREVLGKKLWTMADKGTMWIDPRGDNPVYRVLGSAAPGLIETGMFGNIRFPYDVELGKALHQAVVEWSRDRLCKLGFPFAPIWAHPFVLPEDAKPEENIAEFLRKQDYFSVSSCPCRLSHWLNDPGNHCHHMLETCLHSGEAARWFVQHGQGREITYEEAMELLKKANADGLVHSININGFICNCCTDCCPLFIGFYQFKTKTMIPSPFMPKVLEEDCVACGDCAELCPVKAITVDRMAVIDPDICIGCGVCVTHCPSAAMKLIRRPQAIAMPDDVAKHVG